MAERPEDLNLPNSVVSRIIKEALPPNCKVSKEAQAAVAKAASVFVLYATSCANNVALKSHRKTIHGNDVIKAMDDMEFEKFIKPLENSLECKFKRIKFARVLFFTSLSNQVGKRVNKRKKTLPRKNATPKRRRNKRMGMRTTRTMMKMMTMWLKWTLPMCLPMPKRTMERTRTKKMTVMKYKKSRLEIFILYLKLKDTLIFIA